VLRRRGFTLIEILVVMAIILTLVGLLATGLGSAREKAKSKSSKALIGRVQTALESYFSEFRDYPPDGYDVEPGWTYTANEGVKVGTQGVQQRAMRGTAALMYFLCRPLVKITYMGDPSDPRNKVLTPVGPFLQLDAACYSRGRGDEGSNDDLSRFDPGFVWAGGGRATQFWDTAPYQYKTVEIIDAYYRPLCYDKVKVNNGIYFQPTRFHDPQGSASTTGSSGANAHPDQSFLATISCLDDEEQVCPRINGANHDLATASNDASGTRWRIAVDPRFRPGQSAPDGCCPNTNPGSTTSHAPRNIGGYDLWSYGRSYTNPRDDITSWGD
jgi:prepilin-type N-terminal cleavage/methylation domain-containing protein